MHPATIKLDLVPSESCQLGDSEPMTIGNKNQSRVAMSMPSGLTRSLHQPFNFGVSEILTRSNFFVFGTAKF